MVDRRLNGAAACVTLFLRRRILMQALPLCVTYDAELRSYAQLIYHQNLRVPPRLSLHLTDMHSYQHLLDVKAVP